MLRPHLAQSGSPPITRVALPTCRVHYPDGPNGCMCRLLPRSRDLPRFPGESASILKLSRPAQTSLALRPAGSLSRPRRPLSRGSGPVSHPAKPLVSYQINRQLSGWNLPPLATRAFGAHGNNRKNRQPPRVLRPRSDRRLAPDCSLSSRSSRPSSAGHAGNSAAVFPRSASDARPGRS